MNECNICLEKYNKKITNDEETYRTGNKISCIKCNYSSCTHCTKRYLLESPNEARCMNCKHTWTRDFLVQNFTKIFINKDYRKHREEMLFEREKSFIPNTMIIINKENEIKELHRQKEQLRKEYDEKIYNLDVKIWNLENSSNKKEVNKFMKKCRVTGCLGYLSSKWKCGICETYTCKDCHVIIGKKISNHNENIVLPSHECKQEDIKTIKLLNKDCKNCPKCNVPIFKIDGCNQMWCVECKTAFSWRTGEIITGHFHNPHYYEWLRENNNGVIAREPGDNPCFISHRTLLNHIMKIFIRKNQKNNNESISYQSIMNDNNNYKFNNYNIKYILSFLCDLHRYSVHINDINIEQINRTCLINDEDKLFNHNLYIRKSYLKKYTNEEDFKKEIQKKEKKIFKLIDRKQIYETFINVVNEIFRTIVKCKEEQEIINCIKQILNITNHINEELFKHKKLYNCTIDYLAIEKSQKRIWIRGHNRLGSIECININFQSCNNFNNKIIHRFNMNIFNI